MSAGAEEVDISIEVGDATEFEADVLALRDDQALFTKGVARWSGLPPAGGHSYVDTLGRIGALHVLVMDVPEGDRFVYWSIRQSG